MYFTVPAWVLSTASVVLYFHRWSCRPLDHIRGGHQWVSSWDLRTQVTAHSQTTLTVTKCLGYSKHSWLSLPGPFVSMASRWPWADSHRWRNCLHVLGLDGCCPGCGILGEGTLPSENLFQITKSGIYTSALFAVPCKLLLLCKCVTIFCDFLMTKNYFVKR